MVTINYREPKPISKAWTAFLTDDDVEHKRPSMPNPTDLVPYAFMTFEDKMDRANLKLAFSVFQSIKSKIFNAQNESETSSYQQTSSNDSNKSSASENPGQNGGRKRRRAGRSENNGNDSNDGNEDNDSDDQPTRRTNKGMGRNVPQKHWHLACPYAKKLPSLQMSCKDATWPSIHRLKYVTFFFRGEASTLFQSY
jgi:hypothetical protein